MNFAKQTYIQPFFFPSVTGFICFMLVCVALQGGHASAHEHHSLHVSDMQVRIVSNNHTATFRLYDTGAARQFYKQLPLQVELHNFRDAQWIFYPPEKLQVTKEEAYHTGVKGELSYYAPWGDVFMLYTDFYAGDEMHRLGVCVSGVDDIAPMTGNAKIEQMTPLHSGNNKDMEIKVIANGRTTIYKLNTSRAAQELYNQLPMDISVEDYGGKEKIFYPPNKLSTADTPRANAKAGTLAYYAPWGDVVMFYEDFGSADGLFELGEAVSGREYIQKMSGKIQLMKH